MHKAHAGYHRSIGIFWHRLLLLVDKRISFLQDSIGPLPSDSLSGYHLQLQQWVLEALRETRAGGISLKRAFERNK